MNSEVTRVVGFVFSLLLCLAGSVSAIASPELGEQVFQATGTLHVDGSPVGMEVALDGRVAGQVPDSGVLIIENIAVGQHSISSSYPGYENQELWVDVPDGLPAEVRINLKQGSVGSLEISSIPPNVQIYVDDLYKGITPAVVDVPTGPHVVLLRLAGYQDWSTEVEVLPDQVMPVSGPLTPVSGTPVSTPSGGPGIPALVILAGVGCLLALRLRGKP